MNFFPIRRTSERRRCDYGGRRAQAGCGPCKNWGRARLWQIRGSCPSSKSEENFARQSGSLLADKRPGLTYELDGRRGDRQEAPAGVWTGRMIVPLLLVFCLMKPPRSLTNDICLARPFLANDICDCKVDAQTFSARTRLLRCPW